MMTKANLHVSRWLKIRFKELRQAFGHFNLIGLSQYIIHGLILNLNVEIRQKINDTAPLVRKFSEVFAFNYQFN